MGKKSRLKRERRTKSYGALPENYPQKATVPTEDGFEIVKAKLRAFLREFDPADVIISLGVSDLWRPNRSSQVRHHLALVVALSVPEREYSAVKRIGTYEQFHEFATELYRCLPPIPWLEDFVPEPDWGEVRVRLDEGFDPIFYGCSVERIPDFIEAFRLLHAEEPLALADMDWAITLQSHAVRSVSSDVAGNAEYVRAGHVEVPSESFWIVCSKGLQSACIAPGNTGHAISEPLTLELGRLGVPGTWGAFGDAVLTGTLVPALMVRVAGGHLPIALRSVTSVVIDFWAKRALPSDGRQLRDFNRRVATFLAKRLRSDAIVPGPVRLVSASHKFDRYVAAVLNSANRFYLVLLIDPTALSSLGRIERQVQKLVNDNDGWGLLLADGIHGMEFRRGDGSLPRASDIQVLAVLARVSTEPTMLPLEDITARVIGLPDFVSIFDSLKNGDELEKFWAYADNNDPFIGGFCGLADRFASFRDTHALLIEGAVEPNLISLDPHWSSNWRFQELKTFWENAPRHFPDGNPTWRVDPKSDGIQRLIAKGPWLMAWSGQVGDCTVQAIMEVETEEPDYETGPLLELFVHCVVDALVQRSSILASLEPFSHKQIVIRCRANEGSLVSQGNEPAPVEQMETPLLTGWQRERSIGSSDAAVNVATEVNLARLHTRLEAASDASFEVECAQEVVLGLCHLLHVKPDDRTLALLLYTASRQPRFTIHTEQRIVDVPNFCAPEVPEPEHYKLARRDLAILLKEQEVAAPARYELAEAKRIIDMARDSMRRQIHERIAQLDRRQLLVFCIEQHDKLTARYQHEEHRLKLSLSHEVSFDRAAVLAEAHEKFTREARNYRYLLENRLSLPGDGDCPCKPEQVVQLVAHIDWLSVLYGTSDTLHNDIEVAGLELSDWYIPSVTFSEGRDEKERQYSQVIASAKLGIGLLEEDEVNSAQEAGGDWDLLDEAFVTDLGFSLTQLVQTLLLLSRWHSVGGCTELTFRYSASLLAVVGKLVEKAPGMSSDVAHKLVQFLTLDPAQIRRLVGKSEAEPDVPVWEHFKRDSRYLIRPLIDIGEGELGWGAATVGRVSSIWTGSIADGYLPADFGWPNVAKAVRTIKAGIEKQLEIRAAEICSRTTPYVLHGIDFRRRFPKEKFDDVGDYDVLVYWPEQNRWMSVECKYNQPPFCLKDMRRLRERIFGKGEERGQFGKIERRREFLARHVNRLRQLLQWPDSTQEGTPSFVEIYVCRHIYWWMLYPPYSVPTEFLRVDALDAWLSKNLSD